VVLEEPRLHLALVVVVVLVQPVTVGQFLV
jgi:hypothetical protein